MYGRRRSPYDQSEDLQSRRREMISIIVGAMLLAGCINLFTSAFYDLLLYSFGSGETADNTVTAIQWALILVIGLLSVACTAFLLLRLQRSSVKNASIDIAIPYHLDNKHGLQVLLQDPHVPTYRVVPRAFNNWRRRWYKAPEAHKCISEYWQQRGRKSVHRVLYVHHLALVEASIVYAIHNYCKRSLNPSLQHVSNWYVPISVDSQPLKIVDLPPVLRDNPFLRAGLGSDFERWHCHWPQRVTLSRADGGPGKYVLRLTHADYGELRIIYNTQPWISVPGAFTADLLAVDTHKHERIVLGTRIDLEMDFKIPLRPKVEFYHFHDWTAGFIAVLEEEQDWRYFMAIRPGLL